MSTQNPPMGDVQHELEDEKPIDRRRFLEAGFWTSTGVVGLALASAGARFLAGNAFEPTREQWVKVDEIAKLPAGQVHQVTYTMRRKDAWRTVDRPGLLCVFSDNGAEYMALDATCTHLGCNVHWRAELDQFRCPCHDGHFSRAGEVLGGPPPRPLARLQTKIEDGVLYALV